MLFETLHGAGWKHSAHRRARDRPALTVEAVGASGVVSCSL